MMRCSYFEARLDAYVDGDVPPRQRAHIAAHLGQCAGCAELLAELRVVDALLLAPRRLEPAANFTFKVMADVRALPAPHVRHTPALPILGTYVVFAWATIGAFLWWGGAAASAMLITLRNSAQYIGVGLGALGTSANQVFGAQTADVTRTMGGILAGDIVLAGALAALIAWLRRLQPATSRKGGS